LGLALKRDPIEFGWYMPPILNAFGATAAAGKLLKLNAKQFLDAFSLALCQATCSAELTRNPKTVVRAVRDAFSAKTGVVSALLAEMGVRGFEHPFEGQAGLFRLYARDEYDPSLLTNGLGRTFEGANVSFKPWPCCRGTHPFLEAAIKFLEGGQVEGWEVEKIVVTISSSPSQRVLCEPLERKRRPKTTIDAKFSIPFVLATALVHGDVRLRHFSCEALEDKRVLSLADRVVIEVDKGLPAGKGILEFRSGGRIIKEQTPDFVYGHPMNPMSLEEVIKKFTDCAGYSKRRISREAQERIIERILDLEEQDDIGVITRYL